MKKQNIIKAIAMIAIAAILFTAGNASAASKKSAKKAASKSAKTATATLKVDNNTTGMSEEEAKVYKTLVAQKKTLKEGKKWTNKNSYKFKGGLISVGYGCSAFAFKMSDKAFGTAKAKRHTNYSKIKVGDIVRMDDNTHSVIVLKVVGKKLVVAEGNYNSSIHWGRVITLNEVKKTGTYVMTRY